MPIEDLRQQLARKNLDFSHIAMKNDGQTVYLVNDVFLTPADAERVAQGLNNLEEFRRPGDVSTGPAGVAWLAAANTLAPVVKTIYDIGKDGWEKFKPSSDLKISVIDSQFDGKDHLVTLSVTNLTPSGIYIDAVSIAKLLSGPEKLSLKQPTVTFTTVNTASFGRHVAAKLPVLLRANSSDNYHMLCPPLLHDGVPRSYGVAQISYSKLDEPAPGEASFTFRLRT